MKPLRSFATELFESSCGIVKAQKLDDPHEDIQLAVMYVPQGTRSPNLLIPISNAQLEPPEMLELSLQLARDQWGPPAIIIHTADAHMKVLDKPPEHANSLAGYQRGDLARDPASKEVLVIMAYCRDDDEQLLVTGRYMPYGYNDDGSIRFDDVINLEEPPGGAFDEVIRQAFTDTKGQSK